MFYSNEKLLSKKDINGNVPEIFCVCGNRSAGKTYSFAEKLIKEWKEEGKLFILVCRNVDEVGSIFSATFSDHIDKYSISDMISVSCARGLFHELYFDDKIAGYAVYLNRAQKLRRYRGILKNVCHMYFDEFLPEDGIFLDDEVSKLMSIHITAAGLDKDGNIRYLPIYMTANTTSVVNPYFLAFNIYNKIYPGCRFIRGDGFVVEFTYNENASKAVKSSGANRALGGGNNYLAYASENKFLLDNVEMVDKDFNIKGFQPLLKVVKKDLAILILKGGDSFYAKEWSGEKTTFILVCDYNNNKNTNLSAIPLKSPTGNNIVLMLRTACGKGRMKFSELKIKNELFSIF